MAFSRQPQADLLAAPVLAQQVLDQASVLSFDARPRFGLGATQVLSIAAADTHANRD